MNLKKTVRNMLIMVLILMIMGAAVEISLRAAETKYDDAFFEQDDENNQLFMMGLERTSLEDISGSYLLSSLLSGVGADSIYNPDYDGYPLITDMPREDIYDENTKRILVLGDSFVWGYVSTDRNELFWHLVETDLRAQGYNVRVDGVAVPGVNSYEELSWLLNSSMVADLDPDMVVFGYLCNDPEEREGDLWANVDGGLQLSEELPIINPTKDMKLIQALNRVAPHIAIRLKNYITAKKLYDSEGEYLFTDTLSPVLKGEVYDRYVEKFVAPLDAYAQQADFPIVVMTLPPYPDNLLQKALYAPLYTMYETYNHVHFYNCLDEFSNHYAARKHAKNYAVNIADAHPGSATHRFYANYMEEFLKKDFSELLGEAGDTDLNSGEIQLNEWLPVGAAPRMLSRTAHEAVYTATYPSLVKSAQMQYGNIIPIHPYCLTLPLHTDYIKLAFSLPIDIAEVEIEGDRLEDVSLYYCRRNEKLGYDDYSVLPFGEKGDGNVWTDSRADQVTALCIHADCLNDDGATLRIRLRTADGND